MFHRQAADNLGLSTEDSLDFYKMNQSLDKYSFNVRSKESLDSPRLIDVLIVDDNSLNLFALTSLIENQGSYRCQIAKNGLDAIEKVTL